MQGTTDLLPLAPGREPSGRGGPGRSPLRRLADDLNRQMRAFGRSLAGLAPLERAVLAYTDAMTRQVQVSDTVFAAVQVHLSDAHMVELTATVAAYNMVSRFLEALQIHSHDAR